SGDCSASARARASSISSPMSVSNRTGMGRAWAAANPHASANKARSLRITPPPHAQVEHLPAIFHAPLHVVLLLKLDARDERFRCLAAGQVFDHHVALVRPAGFRECEEARKIGGPRFRITFPKRRFEI